MYCIRDMKVSVLDMDFHKDASSNPWKAKHPIKLSPGTEASAVSAAAIINL